MIETFFFSSFPFSRTFRSLNQRFSTQERWLHLILPAPTASSLNFYFFIHIYIYLLRFLFGDGVRIDAPIPRACVCGAEKRARSQSRVVTRESERKEEKLQGGWRKWLFSTFLYWRGHLINIAFHRHLNEYGKKRISDSKLSNEYPHTLFINMYII